MNIITVSREFGSGGRELAKRLAEQMGFAYYDKEIIEEVAKKTTLAASYVEQVSERGIATFPIRIGRTFMTLQQPNRNSVDILLAQKNIIQELAGKGNCVIVGRNADTFLKSQKSLNIFVYAQMDYKMQRCRQKGQLSKDLSDKEMQKIIKEIDAGRAKTHEFLSTAKWGVKEAYHLCVNTTGFEIKALVPAIAEFSTCFFNRT